MVLCGQNASNIVVDRRSMLHLNASGVDIQLTATTLLTISCASCESVNIYLVSFYFVDENEESLSKFFKFQTPF